MDPSGRSVDLRSALELSNDTAALLLAPYCLLHVDNRSCAITSRNIGSAILRFGDTRLPLFDR